MAGKSFSFEELQAEIPKGDQAGPAPTQPEESAFGRVLRKGAEASAMVGPVGAATGGALRMAGRAPQAVQQMAGPVERGARTLAEMLTPTSLRQLGSMTGSAGLAGATGELARQTAEKQGAGEAGQKLAEMGGAIGPSAARMATSRLAAPIVEKVGKRLYQPPAEIATPEKAAMRKALTEADIKLLPSEIRESRPLKAVERIFQLVPGSREEFAKFGRENQQAVNLAVAKAFGGVEPNLAPRAMQEADQALGNAYSSLLDKRTFKVNQKIGDDLKRAFAASEELKSLAIGKPRVSQFASALEAGDEIPGSLWKQVRSDVAKYVSTLDESAKLIGRRVLSSIDDIARDTQNLSKQEHDILMGIDRKYSALQVFKDAFRRDPSIVRAGDVDLNKFARQYAAVEPMNVLYGKTAGRGGEYVPLAEAAQTYRVATQPRVPETQAATLAGLGRVATGLGLYGGGFAALPTYPMLGATALAAPTISKGLSKAYLRPEETAQALRTTQISPTAAIPLFTGGKD